MTPDEIIKDIEKLRDNTKILWEGLAELLHCPFKAERRHNDVIITMLRLASAEDALMEAKILLKQISLNDRKVSDLTSKLADGAWNGQN